MTTRVTHRLTIEQLPQRLAVYRQPPDQPIPSWAKPAGADKRDGAKLAGAGVSGGFVSITTTPDETSILIDQRCLPEDVVAERDWCPFKVRGPLSMHATGILASIVGPLARASVPVFVVSTAMTDYVLVRQQDLSETIITLERHHTLARENAAQ